MKVSTTGKPTAHVVWDARMTHSRFRRQVSLNPFNPTTMVAFLSQLVVHIVKYIVRWENESHYVVVRESQVGPSASATK